MEETKKEIKRINVNLFRIRELLGWLGMLLPFILLGANSLIVNFVDDDMPILLNSISHYHYSYVGVIFTGVLMAFALLLVSYKGEVDDSKWWKTDNFITNIAGGLAIIVVLIPTSYDCGLKRTPNTHDIENLGIVHLISAGLFLALLGLLSYSKFSKSKYNKKLFKFCGIMVWICIGILFMAFLCEKTADSSIVFWLETLALFFFGLSWLAKGKAKILNLLNIVSDEEYNEKINEMKPYQIQQ